MSSRCFIAIATGQNIANVAPLLAVARPSDHVVFIESETAGRQRWGETAQEVLRRHGLDLQQSLRLPSNEPNHFYERARVYCWPTGEKVIIGNGGSKPQSMALYEALRQNAPAILYNSDAPCELLWYPHGPQAAAERRPYPDTPLRLEDVVTLRGMTIVSKGEALWINGRLTENGLALAATCEGYGFAAEPTFALHRQHAQIAARRAMRSGREALPRWKHIASVAPALLAPFSRAFERLPLVRRGNLDEMEKGLFNAAVKAAENALRQQPDDGTVAVSPLGPAFERALAARLCHWLRDDGASLHPIVQGVWKNVKFASNRAPDNMTIEADLILLLKNGLLIAFEAKSHAAELKDLDARLINLQRVGSQLARLIVCSPLYSAAQKEDWFEEHWRFAKLLKRHDIEHIAFTLPGQPESFRTLENSRSSETLVKPFEQALRHIFAKYLPLAPS